jgi:hypothetical protein
MVSPVWWASVVGMTAVLAARVPELEAPQKPGDTAQTVVEAFQEEVDGREGDEGPQKGSERPSWWRWFGFK